MQCSVDSRLAPYVGGLLYALIRLDFILHVAAIRNIDTLLQILVAFTGLLSCLLFSRAAGVGIPCI